jgi:hypothetical protein
VPYITEEERAHLAPVLEAFERAFSTEDYEGRLNYLVSSMVVSVWQRTGRYRDIARLTGVLENVKQEFYRRAASPYEDAKIAEHGDIGYQERA